jgi:hypothetical protein
MDNLKAVTANQPRIDQNQKNKNAEYFIFD